LVEKYAALLLPSAMPSSQISGSLQSGHQRPPIAVAAPGRVSAFGLSRTNAGTI